MKRSSPEAVDSFTDIFLGEIDIDGTDFYDTIENLACLNNYVHHSSLPPHQKRRLYFMTVDWIRSHLKEEDKERIRAILPLAKTKIEQLDDETIGRIFPLLENIWVEHNTIWHLLGNTAFLLEEKAEKLVRAGVDYHKTKTTLQKARQNFLDTYKKMVKAVIEDPAQSNKRKQALILAYISTIEQHFAFWRKNSIHPKASADSPFFIDLAGLDLSQIDLRNIPLQHVDLVDSVLAGGRLSGTDISAAQLSRTKGFSLAVDIPAKLLLDAQNEQYGLWQHRLELRAQSFNALKIQVERYNPNTSSHIAQNLSEFQFSVNCYNALVEYKASLDRHVLKSAQIFDTALLSDLTAEQQIAVHSQLENFEKEEALLQEELVHEIYKARCDLCVEYFKEIEQNLKADLPKALKQFDELLLLSRPDKDKAPLPPDVDAKILEIRDDLLRAELSFAKSLLLVSSVEKATQKNSALAKKSLQHIHYMVHHTQDGTLSLELEVAINKVRRDWIRYRIEVEIAQGNLQQAETLIGKLLSDAKIAKHAARCFNELKFYSIDLTDDFLETKVTSENRERERGKIYISTQIDRNYLIFDMNGFVYRGALSGEQISAAKELANLLENSKSRNSILMKAAKESYVHLRFDLKLRIVEEHIKKSEAKHHDSDSDLALSHFYRDHGELERARDPLELAHSKMKQAHRELVHARNKMKDILATSVIQKHTLDLRQRTAFTNRKFWENLPVQNVRMYLCGAQTQALVMEQRLQYNESLFYAIANGDLEQVKYGIEHFSWSAHLSNSMGCTSVIFSCLQGHYDIARYLYEMGSKITTITSPGNADINPLDELVQKKYLEDKERYEPIVLWLIDEGLELEIKNALLLDNAQLSKKSLAQLPDDNSTKEKICELLLTAVKTGTVHVVKSIIVKRKDCVASFPIVEPKAGFFGFFGPKVPTVWQEPPLLHIACKKGHVAIVAILLDKDTPGFDSESNKQSALLSLAESFVEEYRKPDKNMLEFYSLYERWKAIATILCANGAKHDLYTWLLLNEDLELNDVGRYINKDTLDAPCDTEGNTPLHFAVKTANTRLVQYLIDKKARLEPLNSAQETPLYLACIHGHLGIVKSLLAAKVSPDGPRRELTEDEEKAFKDLVKIFPQMNTFKKRPLCLKKDTPLHCAIKNKHPDIVEVLCFYKADLEVKPFGATALNMALHLAREETDEQKDRTSVKMAAILLKYGAHISTPNDTGELPRQIAVRTRNIEAIILLLDAFMAQSPLPRDEAIQQVIFVDLLKIELKEKFCNELVQWALSFRKALHSSESDLIESCVVPAQQQSFILPSALPLSSSLSSSSLSSSCSMFPPAKSKSFNPSGVEFDAHLNEYFQEAEEHPVDLDVELELELDSEQFSYTDEEEFSSHTPPEQREPFYVIPSSPEETKEEEKEEAEEIIRYKQFKRF